MACTHTDCLRDWIAPRIGATPQRDKRHIYKFDCPTCDGHDKVTIEPGREYPFVWKCHALNCDPNGIREWLLFHITADHLGGYKRFREQKPLTKDEQLAEATHTLRAIERALSNGKNEPPALLRIRIGAVLWCGGKVPDDRARFLALAERAGVGRSQRYEAWALRVRGGRLRQQ